MPEPTSLSLLVIGMGFVAVAAARRGHEASTRAARLRLVLLGALALSHPIGG